jgi:hypothetical protein
MITAQQTNALYFRSMRISDNSLSASLIGGGVQVDSHTGDIVQSNLAPFTPASKYDPKIGKYV